MPPGSGLATSIGIGAETTYGTYATPTRWYEIESETLTANYVNAEGSGLAAGVLVNRGSRRVRVSQAAAGTVVLYATQKSLGLLLAHMLSSDVVPTVLTAPAYSATHVDNGLGAKGKSLTIQKGIATTDGTVRPFTFLGCKITQLQLECGKGELVKVTITVDARQVVETQPLVAPTYPTGLIPYGFAGAALKAGTFGAEANAAGITKLTLTIARPLNVDSFYYNNAGLKAEPVQNGKLAITGTAETEWVDKTVFADPFHAGTPFSLIATYTGATINGTTPSSIAVAVPQVYVDSDTPVAAGEDLISPSFALIGTYDDVHPPITVTYVSPDSAL